MSEEKVEIINPPNAVKAKVKVGGPGAVDATTLAKAEQAIAAMSDRYLDWVQDDIAKIDKAYADLAAASEDHQEELDRVFQVSHDMKGQGGSFGYDLVTAIANQLCRMIEKMDGSGRSELEAIRVHIDAIKLVISQRITGDGGKIGDQIMAGLEKVVQKILG